jgi:hypothetical protein
MGNRPCLLFLVGMQVDAILMKDNLTHHTKLPYALIIPASNPNSNNLSWKSISNKMKSKMGKPETGQMECCRRSIGMSWKRWKKRPSVWGG